MRKLSGIGPCEVLSESISVADMPFRGGRERTKVSYPD
jgi:hypothetical protein